MIRVANTVEKNIAADPANPIVAPQNIATDVLYDITKGNPTPGQVLGPLQEYVGRYIQNVGSNACFFAIGQDCTGTSYHGSLAATQGLDCSNHGMRVSVFCTGVGGTTIAPLILRRSDLVARPNTLSGNNTSGDN